MVSILHFRTHNIEAVIGILVLHDRASLHGGLSNRVDLRFVSADEFDVGFLDGRTENGALLLFDFRRRNQSIFRLLSLCLELISLSGA